MILEMKKQCLFLLVTLSFGLQIGICHDFLRFIKWWMPGHRRIKEVLELCFWGMVAIPIFLVFLKYEEGVIRWYGVAMLGLGCFLYEKGIGRPFRRKWGPKAGYLRSRFRKMLTNRRSTVVKKFYSCRKNHCKEKRNIV